jgi:hypothetical protein
MKLINRFLDWLNSTVVEAERRRREGYLAGAANIQELEYRMRALDGEQLATMRGL